MKYHYDEFNNNPYESHRLALDSIENNSKVLDIGCATGYFAKELVKKGCETWGIDQDAKALKKAEIYCKKTFVCNIDEATTLPVPKKYFDYVLLLDVIEHLSHPENILTTIKTHLKDGGKVIVSVPNVAHASIRWMLAKGDFTYTTTGIMDSTHLHFYTKSNLVQTLKNSGYKIIKISPTNGMCKVPFLYKITDRLPASIQYKLVCKMPTLFAYQFVALIKIR